ncbi:MAG: S-layer homology domain-containing protein, partial [Firmicutes bacterium]|nr:S-layer homology domain-containing protein [Bacillota bacterium]
IVGGYTDGTYRPENLVTRAEASVFVHNILNAIAE